MMAAAAPGTTATRNTTKQTIESARRVLEAAVGWTINDVEDTRDYVVRLADGAFLRRVATHVANARGRNVGPGLVPLGSASSSQKNLEAYVFVR